MNILTTNKFEKFAVFITKHNLQKDFEKMINNLSGITSINDILKNQKAYKIDFSKYSDDVENNDVFVYRLNHRYRIFFSLVEKENILLLDIVKHE